MADVQCEYQTSRNEKQREILHFQAIVYWSDCIYRAFSLSEAVAESGCSCRGFAGFSTIRVGSKCHLLKDAPSPLCPIPPHALPPLMLFLSQGPMARRSIMNELFCFVRGDSHSFCADKYSTGAVVVVVVIGDCSKYGCGVIYGDPFREQKRV